jgi:hypothetical protein
MDNVDYILSREGSKLFKLEMENIKNAISRTRDIDYLNVLRNEIEKIDASINKALVSENSSYNENQKETMQLYLDTVNFTIKLIKDRINDLSISNTNTVDQMRIDSDEINREINSMRTATSFPSGGRRSRRSKRSRRSRRSKRSRRTRRR